MSTEPSDDSSEKSSTTSISGGANVDAQHDVNIGGDVVGRDKIASAGGHIIHAEQGATVIIGEHLPTKPDDLSPTQEELGSHSLLQRVLMRDRKTLLAVATVILASMLVTGGLLISKATSCDEIIPIIQNFTVHYPDNSTKSFRQGDVLEIRSGEQLQIEAILPAWSAAKCLWSAGKGVATSITGCATLYTPPLDGTNDSLDVVAKSACGPMQSNSSLFIRVVQSSLQP